jgi:hypothetical protein
MKGGWKKKEGGIGRAYFFFLWTAFGITTYIYSGAVCDPATHATLLHTNETNYRKKWNQEKKKKKKKRRESAIQRDRTRWTYTARHTIFSTPASCLSFNLPTTKQNLLISTQQLSIVEETRAASTKFQFHTGSKVVVVTQIRLVSINTKYRGRRTNNNKIYCCFTRYTIYDAICYFISYYYYKDVDDHMSRNITRR